MTGRLFHVWTPRVLPRTAASDNLFECFRVIILENVPFRVQRPAAKVDGLKMGRQILTRGQRDEGRPVKAPRPSSELRHLKARRDGDDPDEVARARARLADEISAGRLNIRGLMCPRCRTFTEGMARNRTKSRPSQTWRAQTGRRTRATS